MDEQNLDMWNLVQKWNKVRCINHKDRNSLFMTSFDPYNEKYRFISNEPHSSKLKSSFRSQFEICQLDQQWKNYLNLWLQSIAPNALKPLRVKMNTKNTDQRFIKREKIFVNFVTKAIL